MTAVASDRHGLYVLVGGRVGRPAAGQGAGLRAGSRVRAALLGEGVRVRYAGGEQLWPLHLSRRAAGAGGLVLPPWRGGSAQLAAGQRWRTQGGQEVELKLYTAEEVTGAPGAVYETPLGYYDYDGMWRGHRDQEGHPNHLWEMAGAAHLGLAVGQVWERANGTRVSIARVDSSGYAFTRGGSRYTPAGEYVPPPGGPPHPERRLARLVPPIPTNPDGTYAYAVGQVWRTREGREIEITSVGKSPGSFYVADSRPQGNIGPRGEYWPDREDRRDLVAFVRGPA